MTLFLLHVFPRSSNRTNDSSLETRKLEVRHLAQRVHGGTDHQGSMGSERRAKQSPTMPMLCEGVKFGKGHLKSPFDFLQAFIEGLISSSKERKILVG